MSQSDTFKKVFVYLISLAGLLFLIYINNANPINWKYVGYEIVGNQIPFLSELILSGIGAVFFFIIVKLSYLYVVNAGSSLETSIVSKSHNKVINRLSIVFGLCLLYSYTFHFTSNFRYCFDTPGTYSLNREGELVPAISNFNSERWHLKDQLWVRKNVACPNYAEFMSVSDGVAPARFTHF
jgi:succinate dehydrogenase/fumarate reductase cytochrome b subunit